MREPSEVHRRLRSLGPSLRRYRFELIWLAVVALGVFLVLERMNIRATIIRLIRDGVAGLMRIFGRVDDATLRLLSRVTLSDAIGFILIVSALIAIVLRMRWRLMHSSSLTAMQCPRCGGTIHRVHRRARDRVLSLVLPVRRYRCANTECRWQGIRVAAGGRRRRSGVASR